MPKANSLSNPAPLPQDRRFSYRFNVSAHTLAQHMLLQIDREFGLNLAEYRILTVLADRKSSSIRDIAVHAQLDKAHVTRALTEMIGRGLVTQIVDKNDRRLRVVRLTRAGQAIITATLPIATARQERLERRLTASEQRVLWKVLAVLAEESALMLSEVERGSRRRRDAFPIGERNA